MVEPERFKASQRAVWALGDYPQVAQRFEGVAERAVQIAGVGEGNLVADVAAGNGNVAVAAAARGARVEAGDLTPELVELGRRRTRLLDLDVAWEVADAEDLPYRDAAFDQVISVLGAVFAPRPERAAAELVRILRPGGTLVLTAWTPEGFGGRLGAAIGRHLPGDPSVPPPSQWGVEAVARERLAALEDVRAERGHVHWDFESLHGARVFFEETFGILVAARRELGDGYGLLLDDVLALAMEHDVGDGQGIRVDAEYLLVSGRRPPL